MQINVRAYDLSRRLGEIASDLAGLALAARNAGVDFDAAEEFAAAVASVAAGHARLRGCDLVVDAARDPKDQSYAVEAL